MTYDIICVIKVRSKLNSATNVLRHNETKKE